MNFCLMIGEYDLVFGHISPIFQPPPPPRPSLVTAQSLNPIREHQGRGQYVNICF